MSVSAAGLITLVLVLAVGFMVIRLALSILWRMAAVIALIVCGAMFWFFVVR
jgi:hypothetical protein